MKNFEELTEAEVVLRNLIYAIESKDKPIEGAPSGAGFVYLKHQLLQAKSFCEKNGIQLVEVK